MVWSMMGSVFAVFGCLLVLRVIVLVLVSIKNISVWDLTLVVLLLLTWEVLSSGTVFRVLILVLRVIALVFISSSQSRTSVSWTWPWWSCCYCLCSLASRPWHFTYTFCYLVCLHSFWSYPSFSACLHPEMDKHVRITSKYNQCCLSRQWQCFHCLGLGT